MLNDVEYADLTGRFPVLEQSNPKQVDILRDQLKPSDAVESVLTVQLAAGSGLLCLTDSDLYLLWTQTLLWFFKFPAIQTFHRQHLSVERRGSQFIVKAGDEEAEFSVTEEAGRVLEVRLGAKVS